MGLFTRNKKADAEAKTKAAETEADAPTSPQQVGVVSGVLSAGSDGDASPSPFGDVVSRRFGPTASSENVDSQTPLDEVESVEPDATSDSSTAKTLLGEDSSRTTAAPLFSDNPATPALEVDPMAHIGRSTTITGDIVAEEDLEIQGTVEGSVRLIDHQVTVGNEGHVKASVEANVVSVYGRITGNVVASELVEVDKGGIVGGDIKAPRIIMHDGAIVVGGLDMSASMPSVPETKPESGRKTSAPHDQRAPSGVPDAAGPAKVASIGSAKAESAD